VWAIDADHGVWMLKTGTIDDARIIQNADEGWSLIPNIHLIEVDVGFRS